MSISFSFRTRDISTSLFLQLHIFIGANFSGEELKEVLYETIFLNGGDFHGLFHNLNHFISQLIDGVLIFSIVFHNTIVMIFVS